MTKNQRGGAGTLLLVLVLAAAAVYLLVHFVYLDKKSDAAADESEVEGVKVHRNIRSVDRANQVIQDTKNTLRNQEKAMQDRMKKNLNP